MPGVQVFGSNGFAGRIFAEKELRVWNFDANGKPFKNLISRVRKHIELNNQNK